MKRDRITKRRDKLARMAERAAVPERPFRRGPRYIIRPAVSVACAPSLQAIAAALRDGTQHIDEKSLARMEKDAGRWPWPRVVYATLIDGLAVQKPRAIVFDIAFAEADVFRPQDDAAFAEAVGRQANIYFPLLHLPVPKESDRIPIVKLAPYLGLVKLPHADPQAARWR